MSNYYECIRCIYKTNKKGNMITHLHRKNKCRKINKFCKYTNEEIYNLSLKIKNDNPIDVCKDEDKNFICKNCSNIYSSKWFLNSHKKEYCKKKDLDNKTNEATLIANININNNNIVNQNINIINIPLPFDKEWSTDHIDIYLKHILLLTDNKYSELLKQILENKNNLNVILDKNSNTGYIYDSNNIYKNMEKTDIINLSMEKLYNELNKIKKEVKNTSKIPINIEKETEIIETKYYNYVNDKDIQTIVESCLSKIFDKTKKDASIYFQNLLVSKNEGF